MKRIFKKNKKMADFFELIIKFIRSKKNNNLKNPFTEINKILFVIFELENINNKSFSNEDIKKIKTNNNLPKLINSEEFKRLSKKSK